jgi:hypothetical protein
MPVPDLDDPLRQRAKEVLAAAAASGLVGGPRTRVVRGRMPAALVDEAKRRTGIKSDTVLIEAALAHLALADDYMEKLERRRGSVPADVDLDY